MRTEYPDAFKVEGHPEKPDGRYIVPHFRIKNYFFHIIFSTGEGWEHLSVTVIVPVNKKRFRSAGRNPTWEEMCFLKDLFWGEDEIVVQFHPPKSEHISTHDTCLHLWKCTHAEMPAPSSMLVGAKRVHDLAKELVSLDKDITTKEDAMEIIFVYANKVNMEKFPETDEGLKELAAKIYADLQSEPKESL